MASARSVPMLLVVLVGSLIVLLGWGVIRLRSQQGDDALMRTRDDLLWGLLILAAFILGSFMTYVLLRIGF